jgi:chemotaxis signal transduction protein
MDQAPLTARDVHDCWNSIGVRGDKSCPELARHAHCRNCPAYAATAATLLDRDKRGTTDDDWKRDFAAEAAAEQRKTRSAILARLGTEWFALPILLLDQVTEHRRIHSLPHRRSPAVLGMVNVRGQLLICLSLAQVLGIADDATPEGDDRRRMIVMRCAGGRVVVPVDEVQHNCRFHEGELLPQPATVHKSQAAYTLGLLKVGRGMAALMDGDRLAEAMDQSLA